MRAFSITLFILFVLAVASPMSEAHGLRRCKPQVFDDPARLPACQVSKKLFNYGLE